MRSTTKRILFLSKSKLCRNLFDIIVRALPKKFDTILLDDTADVLGLSAARPVHLLIVDASVVASSTEKSAWQFTTHRALTNCYKIALHDRKQSNITEILRNFDFDLILTKPLPAEEIAQRVDSKSGGGK